MKMTLSKKDVFKCVSCIFWRDGCLLKVDSHLEQRCLFFEKDHLIDVVGENFDVDEIPLHNRCSVCKNQECADKGFYPVYYENACKHYEPFRSCETCVYYIYLTPKYERPIHLCFANKKCEVISPYFVIFGSEQCSQYKRWKIYDP